MPPVSHCLQNSNKQRARAGEKEKKNKETEKWTSEETVSTGLFWPRKIYTVCLPMPLHPTVWSSPAKSKLPRSLKQQTQQTPTRSRNTNHSSTQQLRLDAVFYPATIILQDEMPRKPTRRCFACGGQGHKARECANNRVGRTEPVDRSVNRQPPRSEGPGIATRYNEQYGQPAGGFGGVMSLWPGLGQQP
jgi:hypothetical protein